MPEKILRTLQEARNCHLAAMQLILNKLDNGG
jgi:hypothetical protein